MSQLALPLFASQSWKNYTVHLAVLAADAGFSLFFLSLFCFKETVTPVLTEPSVSQPPISPTPTVIAHTK